MIVVTGGCGFIGSNLVASLNEKGEDDILVVDNLEKGDKFRNISNCRISDYLDQNEFLKRVEGGAQDIRIRALFHQGACSDTTERNGRYMMQNNYEYSKVLLEYCLAHSVPYIYASSASVYGAGGSFKEEPQFEDALNVYAYSKLQFDRYVRNRLREARAQIVGLRYFNVYGPNEQHKGKMASVAFHFFHQYQADGYVKLFEGSGGYGNGEQRRDFVWVGDAADVNLHFLEHPDVSGIFNVGTGQCRSFNDVATAVINRCEGTERNTEDLVAASLIRYIPFPDQLLGKYQSYTQADIDVLRSAGYTKEFASLEQGVSRYIDKLEGEV